MDEKAQATRTDNKAEETVALPTAIIVTHIMGAEKGDPLVVIDVEGIGGFALPADEARRVGLGLILHAGDAENMVTLYTLLIESGQRQEVATQVTEAVGRGRGYLRDTQETIRPPRRWDGSRAEPPQGAGDAGREP